MTIFHRKFRGIHRTTVALESCEARLLMATAPLLGAAAGFAVLGGSTVANIGASHIVGSVGVSPGTSITGFPPGIITGGLLHAGDALATTAEADLGTAYNFLAAEPSNVILTGQNLGGLTLTPGVYNFASSAQLTGALTLNAQGDPNAVFVFQLGTALTTASDSSIVLINNAHAANVYWQIGSSATLGTGTAFQGNILAFTSITMNTGASNAPGRLLAINGAITLDTNSESNAFALPLTITANNQSKLYGTALPPLTVSYTGFVNGDTTASLTTQPTVTTLGNASSPVGNYAITASGAVDPYYTISYVDGSLSVASVPLTITADNQSKLYGAALPSLTVSYTGFVNGDTSASLTTQPTVATLATTASQVGTYSITASDAVDPNYTISYVAGSLSVTSVPLTITADNQSEVFGSALPLLTVKYVGFVNGDTSTSLTTQPTVTTTAIVGSHVGAYPIMAIGAADPNYSISYVAGTLTVTPAPLTFTGTVFLDLNATGVIADRDPGLAGRVVYVDIHGDGMLHADDPQATTDASGNFAISGLTVGTYTLRVVTYPNDNPTGPGGNQLILTSTDGLILAGANFGLLPGSTVVPRTPTPIPFAGGATMQGAVIESIYRTILGRQGETAGIDHWLARFDGGETYKQIANEFLESTEYRINTIDSYYETYLGRTAEPAGSAFWLSRFQAGDTESQISEAFLSSPEYNANHVDSASYVESLSVNLLGRDATQTELNSQSQSLAAGMTRRQLAVQVVESTEAYLRGINGDYSAFLARVGEDSGVAFWLNLVQDGRLTLAGVEAEFLNSPEFVARASKSF